MTIKFFNDDKGVRHMIKRILAIKGKYAIEEAEDGLKAGKKLESFPADLVILDIKMPQKDGYKTCMDIRNSINLKDIKILGISGTSGKSGKILVEKYGANRFLGKPFDSKLFKKIVEQLLRKDEKKRTDNL